MDSRTAAHVLARIAAYLELAGENRFKAKAYRTAARSILALGADDLAPLLRRGELASVRGLGPATLAVVTDLVETGTSRYLEQLRDGVPEGLLELRRVPGLSVERIQMLYRELGITSLDDLEAAATSGRLAKVKRMGPKSARKILDGIAFARRSASLVLHHQAMAQARPLLDAVRSHPDVMRAELAGSLRRCCEVVADVDIVAECRAAPASVAQSFARLAGVSAATGDGAAVSIRFVDGACLDLYCVAPGEFALALLRATGGAAHVSAVLERLAARGLRREGDAVVDAQGVAIPYEDERVVYSAAGLAWVAPELREQRGELDAAERGTLPRLVEPGDIRGALHCHTTWSDGTASIAEMAQAARARGWSYLGISDHSQAAFYASGVSREQMLEQLDEIDELNGASPGDFRILKGVEADILADGRLDYDADLLDRFDYVIASVHSRFQMDRDAMTGRVLTAMDDRHMTMLAHPTGRLLLSREPYDLDLDAVLEKAAASGVAIELNADPHRLDLDWRHLQSARERGVTIAIGPDAHAPRALDYTAMGVAMARKGWLEAGDILNTRDAAGVLAFARARRSA